MTYAVRTVAAVLVLGWLVALLAACGSETQKPEPTALAQEIRDEILRVGPGVLDRDALKLGAAYQPMVQRERDLLPDVKVVCDEPRKAVGKWVPIMCSAVGATPFLGGATLAGNYDVRVRTDGSCWEADGETGSGAFFVFHRLSTCDDLAVDVISPLRTATVDAEADAAPNASQDHRVEECAPGESPRGGVMSKCAP